jgi:DNA-binding transcriptional LysR family regulator
VSANFVRQLELRHLAVLQAVAEGRTFWAASEALDCTPSAVSQQVAALEKITGQRLVERSRGRRQVKLTEAGALLLRHAEAIVARLRAAEADFEAFAEGAAGTLRVGSYQSIGKRIVPRLLRDFANEWPGVDLKLTEGESDSRLLELIERGELDLSFTTLPIPPGPFEWVRMMRDPYVLALPSSHPLATRAGRVAAEDLGALELVGNRSCQEQVDGYLRTLGVDPRVAFVSSDNSVVQGLVAAGMGAAIAPLLTLDEADPQVTLREVDGFPPRVLVLAWHRDRYRSRAALAFTDRAAAVCAEVEQRIATVRS